MIDELKRKYRFEPARMAVDKMKKVLMLKKVADDWSFYFPIFVFYSQTLFNKMFLGRSMWRVV